MKTPAKEPKMKKPISPARKAARMEAKLNKSRKFSTSSVSAPTFFEIAERPMLVFVTDLTTGESLDFDLKTAVFS